MKKWFELTRGIVMPADPSPGHAYRQEYYEGEAEDLGQILRIGQQATVAFGHFDDVVVTREAGERRRMYREAAVRRQHEETFVGPRSGFLASLDMHLTVRASVADDLDRAVELTQRTHQLNTTGLLFDRDELTALMSDDDHLVLSVELVDLTFPLTDFTGVTDLASLAAALDAVGHPPGYTFFDVDVVGGDRLRFTSAYGTTDPFSDFALTKTILNQSFELSSHDVFAQGSQAQGICYTSSEHRASVEAFLAKSAAKE